jgi:hypothetical protein
MYVPDTRKVAGIGKTGIRRENLFKPYLHWDDVGPFSVAGDAGGISGSYSAVSSGPGGDSGVLHALTHVAQLPDKQPSLQDRDAKHKQRDESQPPRIISDPLRFESELFINFRFLVLLGFLFLVCSSEGWLGITFTTSGTCSVPRWSGAAGCAACLFGSENFRD